MCDILIAGAGTGGFAAAIAAAEAGASVILTEETSWPGGQLTVQGVCTPDEHAYIEIFGGTRRYCRFRDAIRTHYRSDYTLSPTGAAQPFLNPGSCWVSRISFEPKAGVRALAEMARPLEESGRLRILYRTIVGGCTLDPAGTHIDSVSLSGADGDSTVSAAWVLDATDMGDLLPLCGMEGADWVTGAESRQDTGEPDAPVTSRRDWVQPFTFPFGIEWSPGTRDSNVIEPPADYDALKALQRYHIKHGAITGLFAGQMPWWRYRRLLAAENFDDSRIPNDVAMINTAGNDYYGGNVLGSAAGDPRQTFARARRASLGYLYWLQTECPREDGPTGSTKGYPEFRLKADLFDTPDGCSIMPYIRESRRIRAVRPILEQEIVVQDFSGRPCRGDCSRAAYMPDSVGIGHYALDIHPNGHGEPNHFVATRPFQIPLGALIPHRLANLLPACKNLGVTHLTNGAYRLHPIEWNIGESAGLLAAHCLCAGTSPRAVRDDAESLRAFQHGLIREGIPLHWLTDVPQSHPAFAAVQTLAGAVPSICRDADLLFRPEEPVSPEDWSIWRAAAIHRGLPTRFDGTRAEAALLVLSPPAG